MQNLKKLIFAACVIATMGTLSAADQVKDSDVNKIIMSEMLGYSLGKSLNAEEIDREALIRGIINGAENGPLPVCDQDCEKVMEKLQEKDVTAVKEKLMKKWKKISKTNG